MHIFKIYKKGAGVSADPAVSYRFGAITIPHIDWIEPLRLECEDFANSIRTGAKPRANGEVGLEVVKILAAAQEALERQVERSAAPSAVYPAMPPRLIAMSGGATTRTGENGGTP